MSPRQLEQGPRGERRKHFLFCLADERWLLFQKAERILGGCAQSSINARSEETISNSETLIRTLDIAAAPKGYKDWEHIRTILRIHSQTFKDAVLVCEQNKYLVSSKEPTAITGEQWLALIPGGGAWKTICTGRSTSSLTKMSEPWIEAEPRGTVVVMLLRRIAYTLLALFRSVTLRNEIARRIPWRELLAWVYDTHRRHRRALGGPAPTQCKTRFRLTCRGRRQRSPYRHSCSGSRPHMGASPNWVSLEPSSRKGYSLDFLSSSQPSSRLLRI